MLPQTRLEKTLGGTQIAKDVCSSDLCSRKSFVHRHEIHARRIFLSKRNSLVRVECCRKPGWRKLWAVPRSQKTCALPIFAQENPSCIATRSTHEGFS